MSGGEQYSVIPDPFRLLFAQRPAKAERVYPSKLERLLDPFSVGGVLGMYHKPTEG